MIRYITKLLFFLCLFSNCGFCQRTVCDVLDQALELSWQANNALKDYFNFATWRRNQEFSETIYETIPGILKRANRDLIDIQQSYKNPLEEQKKRLDLAFANSLDYCGVDFKDHSNLDRLTGANWNYILFVNCVKFMTEPGYEVAFIRELKEQLTKDDFNLGNNKYADWIENLRIYIDKYSDSVNAELLQTFKEIFKEKTGIEEANIIGQTQCLRNPLNASPQSVELIAEILKIATWPAYHDKIEQAVNDIKIYMEQLDIYHYLEQIARIRQGGIRCKYDEGHIILLYPYIVCDIQTNTMYKDQSNSITGKTRAGKLYFIAKYVIAGIVPVLIHNTTRFTYIKKEGLECELYSGTYETGGIKVRYDDAVKIFKLAEEDKEVSRFWQPKIQTIQDNASSTDLSSAKAQLEKSIEKLQTEGKTIPKDLRDRLAKLLTLDKFKTFELIREALRL